MADLPRYGLAMICRNEAAVIRPCLESLRPHVGYWVISDTGSTDGTQDIIREVLGDIPGELMERPWVNFGHNRSEVFAAVRGTCDFFFATDADMVWSVDDDFEPDLVISAYTIEMGSGGFSYRLPLLLRGNLDWHSVGAVHEYTALREGPYASLATDKVRIDMRAAGGNRASMEKSLWHLSLLEAELAENPDNARSTFYLGQTLRDLGRYDDAREAYLKRAKMGGFEEERWYASYMAATLGPWPDKAIELMEVWNTRPHRIEPLASLLRELNSRSLHQVAYRLAQLPDAIPKTDIVFVHTSAWNWQLKFERSIAAYWVGHKDECRELCDELLALDDLPDNIRAQAILNRSYCGDAT